MNKLTFIAKTLERLGILNRLSYCNKNKFFVLNFHRIRKTESSVGGFSDDVFGLNVKEFEILMAWISQNFYVLSESDLLSLIKNPRSFDRSLILITFDDGYVDNYTLAYPVLKKYKLPAIFFIPYSIIEDRLLGWWDITSYLLKNSKKSAIEIGRQTVLIENNQENAIRFFYDRFKNEKNLDKAKTLLTISEKTGVGIPERQIQTKEMMSWNQIREMQENGMAIGSHTVNHHVLSTLDEVSQFEEISNSKKLIEEKLNKEINSFAYPVGGVDHFTDATQKMVKKAGYSAGFSFYSGVNAINCLDRFNIRRISPFNDLSRFKLQLFLLRKNTPKVKNSP